MRDATQELMQRLVDEFRDCTIAQTECIRKHDARTGNRYAKQQTKAFERLRQCGDVGRDCLMQLLSHSRSDVRVMAACHLLRYCPDQAINLLRIEAQGNGLASLGASECLKRWEEADWNLDPE